MKFASSFSHPQRSSYPALTALFVIGLILSAASVVAAQGIIKGKVVADIPDQRKALSGVVVSVSGDRLTGKKLQSVSNEEGVYEFRGLTAGDYQLSVELTGFRKYE